MIVFGSLAAIVLLLAVTSGGDDVAYDNQSDVTSTVSGTDGESVTGETDVEVGEDGADGRAGVAVGEDGADGESRVSVQSENGSRSVVRSDGGTVVFSDDGDSITTGDDGSLIYSGTASDGSDISFSSGS